MMTEHKTNILDKFNLLGLKIWEFSLRSLSREYSWFFLYKILLRHPLKSLKGLKDYQKFSQTIDQVNSKKIYKTINSGELINQIQKKPRALLVAMGYCQRPLKTEDQYLQCPSERFSHDCYFADHFNQSTVFPQACSICEIKPVAELALKVGASFHIMTSAMDIARDIFIPSLEKQRFQYAIMFICPYSVLPITLPLLICGIKFIILPYAMGDCRNYMDFVQADVGIKPKRTFPMEKHQNIIIHLLKKISPGKNCFNTKILVTKHGNFYLGSEIK